MEITIKIDDALLADVDCAAQVQEMSRSEAFMDALRSWVIHQPNSSKWTIDWSKWEGDPDFPPFESHRDDYPAHSSEPQDER